MIGASSLQDFNNYFQLFKNTMGGFRELTDSEKLNRQPERVRIKTVEQTGTLAEAFSRYNVKEQRMNELAILNGMNLNDRIERGTLIKVIE